MNLALEVCRACPVQCRLEDKSKEIVVKAKKQSLNPKQVRELVSAMTLMANRIPCPQTEVSRIRKEAFGQIDPKLVEVDSRFKFFVKKA